MNSDKLAETLSKIIDIHKINQNAAKFVRPFTKDCAPTRFWEICCFVADRRSTTMTDINRHFYGSCKSDWHSVILYLCRCGLLSKFDRSISVGRHFEKYRAAMIASMNQ